MQASTMTVRQVAGCRVCVRLSYVCVCVLSESNKRVEEALRCARMLKWMSFECSGSPGMQI